MEDFIRYDPLKDRFILFSPERAKRPVHFSLNSVDSGKSEKECPFCPGNEDKTPEAVHVVKGDGVWKIRVFPNKYPAISSFFGAHEVVVETPDHLKALEDLEVHHIEEVLKVFAKRMGALYDSGAKYVAIFKNHGKEAGASIPHSHSQIIALPFEPAGIKRERVFLEDFFRNKERCYMCRMVEEELASKKRVVYENACVVALSYKYAAFPFETWIVPKKHISSVAVMSGEVMKDVADTLKWVLLRLKKTLGFLSYNLVFKDWWLGEMYHFWIEVIPRITHIAGFEIGTSSHINPVVPEDAVDFLE